MCIPQSCCKQNGGVYDFPFLACTISDKHLCSSCISLFRMPNRKKCFCMQRYFSCNPEVHLDPATETHEIKL